ncbi:serine protease [Candidatus Eisenbacteria bacterium]|uniref:Serine protease n=1 Tax=Eiseniibacteriota bacterium TaxID=2212470 RepID=A0ABV6YLU6_UNCEI
MGRAGWWFLSLITLAMLTGILGDSAASDPEWSRNPPGEWPQITMINEIEYTDKHHPIAGCGFLLDVGSDTIAVTAKHILVYFKSGAMASVSFGNTLKYWRMYPKNNPDDIVVVDRLINENTDEVLDRIPAPRDWLLFTVKQKSPHIQPLKLRETPLVPGEPVYIVGWRYSDKECPQVIYKGAFVRSDGETELISTEVLADNTMPGLSGSPVIDAHGRVIGLMSQKAGKLERLSSTAYPRRIWKASRE